MMAKWSVDGRGFLKHGGLGYVNLEEIARKLNAFEGMLEALKAILTNPASAIAYSDLERALYVIDSAEGK